MASSSGNSSGSTGCEGDLQVLMNERKRKRMQSNRESARRSRMRKQNHLDELMGQVTQLTKENNQIITSTNITTQHYLNIEAENSILRAQMSELIQRLNSLDEILNNNNNYIINTNNNFDLFDDSDHFYGTHHPDQTLINNPWNLMYLNQQPIMASADMFHY